MEKNMQVVKLGGWYDWPVHCPFCGLPHDKDGDIVGCRHLLYVFGLGQFFYRSKRFNTAVNLESYADWGDELPTQVLQDLGGGEVICASIDFSNHIQFQIESPSDIGLVGFACIDEELVGWGREPISPAP
jgi:hypothetical protein